MKKVTRDFLRSSPKLPPLRPRKKFTLTSSSYERPSPSIQSQGTGLGVATKKSKTDGYIKK